jgi:hypothetical protein
VRPLVLGPCLFVLTFAAVSAYRLNERRLERAGDVPEDITIDARSATNDSVACANDRKRVAEVVQALAAAQAGSAAPTVSQKLLAGKELTPIDKLAVSQPGAAALKRAISNQLGMMTIRSRCMAGLSTPYTDLELDLDVETGTQAVIVRARDVVVSKGAPVPAQALECLKHELSEVSFPPASNNAPFAYAGPAKQHVIFRN